MTEALNELAVALVRAQGQFPAITRDKKVTVKTKTGGTYDFAYAPLDSILAAVRKPLTDNDLALVQLLDPDELVTMLIHASGQTLASRTALPQLGEIQAFGSAVTYLRRYAIQAMLGIAAEEDDDGNRAAGNAARPLPSKVEQGDDGSFFGTVEAGNASTSDYLLRQTPTGSALGFRLRGERGGYLVQCKGRLAEQMLEHKDAAMGKRVQVWGRVHDVDVPGSDKKRGYSYTVITADRIRVPDIGDLPTASTELPAEADSMSLFSDDEQAAIDEALGTAG